MKFFVTVIFLIFVVNINAFSQTIKTTVSDSNIIEQLSEHDAILSSDYLIKQEVNDGYYKIFYDNDFTLLAMSGNIENSSKQGEWKFYYETGVIKCTTFYKNGIKHKTERIYDINGNLIRKINYNMGIIEGDLIQYHTNGNIRIISKYKNGIPYGKALIYDENKKLIKEILY